VSLAALFLVLQQSPPDQGQDDAGDYSLTGEVAVGQHFVGRRGNVEEFKAEEALDTGLFLRSFRLEAERKSDAALLDSFEVIAEGLGEPEEHARFAAELDHWRASGRYFRSRFTGVTTSDQHPFDIERHGASLGVEHADIDTRMGVELSWVDRRGLAIGTRSVDFGFVAGFPRLTRDWELAARSHFDRDLGWAELSWTIQAARLTTNDDLSFTLPSPSFPAADVSEEFAADTRGNSLGSSIRLTHATDDGLWRLDGGVSLSRNHQAGNSTGHETGFFFDPSLPFIKDSTGKLANHLDAWSVDLGATRILSPEAEVYLRLKHEDVRAVGHLDRVSTLDELMGDPPSVYAAQDLAKERTRRDTLELGSLVDLADSTTAELSVSLGREDLFVLEQIEGMTTRFFDDSLLDYGADGTLDWDLSDGWDTNFSAGFGRRPTETALAGPSFTFRDQRSYYLAAGARWRPAAEFDLTLSARHDGLESTAFDANEETERLSLSGSWRPAEDLSLQASYSHTSFDLSSETSFVFVDPMTGTSTVPATVTYQSIERMASAALRWQAASAFQPALVLTRVETSGSSAFVLSHVAVQLPYLMDGGRELGVELALIDFDSTGVLASSAYEAGIFTVYLRQGF